MIDAVQMRAQGRVLVLVAKLLEEQGVMLTGEFKALLGVFAAAVGEDDASEGAILAYWAGSITDSPRRSQ